MSNTHLWNTEAYNAVLQGKLFDTLKTYTHIRFDHLKVAHVDSKVVVFVVKGNQSAVLYDKTEGFPSAKLMASLVLLGSP